MTAAAARRPKVRIEEAVVDLLARHGYTGTGLKAISDAAGLPYGSIYHHFPGGKEEIAVTAITTMGAYMARLLRRLYAGGVTDEAVTIMFDYMVDRLESSDWESGCPIGTPALDGGTEAPAVREACDRALGAMVDAIADALAADDGRGPDGGGGGLDRGRAHDLATTVLATYEGATLLARAKRSRAPLDAARASTIALVRAARGSGR